jgi:hypothetical protein
VNDQPPAEARRSRRIYVWWGVSLSLLVAAAVFSWLVVVPVRQVRSAGLAWRADQRGTLVGLGAQPYVKRLGEPARAAAKIRTYLRYSAWVPGAQEGFEGAYGPRVVALFLLTGCGSAGIPALLEHTSHSDEDVRWNAALNIRYLAGDVFRPEAARAAVTALISVLEHPEANFRGLAAQGLGEAGAAALPAVPLLERVSKLDADSQVREAAEEALEKIQIAAGQE